MDDATRKSLTEGLSAVSVRIAGELRERMRHEPPVRARAERLHADEKVGDDFEVWTDLLSRRAAVMWVLKSVYVRVLEDRGLLSPRRIVDATSPQLFARLAPDLGETAYLRWVFRDLSRPEGGLPELFALQPAEIAWPSDAMSRELLDFWRRRDPDTGELSFRFDDERFDGRLLGDLYQDLDPVVKDRFALLQTPDFILDFILDETLTPAIEEFGIDEVRVLDPACGSGHFLLEAFRRLVVGMREAHPEREVTEVVRDVLSRVVGIDLNDYACGLARARLVMTALETLGSGDLADASGLHPQVFWADGLEQVEREEPEQLTLGIEEAADKPRAMLTRPEVRASLRPILKAGFHAVVGNPPYITEKDKARKEYHREKLKHGPRYVSAYRTYSLGAPFTERMFQLAVKGGFIGEITANSFMKREFGKALIQDFFPRVELTKVVDTSGAYIPGHGTPTVLLFGRNKPAPIEGDVPVVMGKRGEPGKPDVPANGHVWTSIRRGHREVGFEDEYVSVALVARGTVATHPWSIGGGGAAELKEALDAVGPTTASLATSIGFMSFSGADDVFGLPASAGRRLGFPAEYVRVFVTGDAVRDWVIDESQTVIAPYDGAFEIVPLDDLGRGAHHFWSLRTTVLATTDFGGASRASQGHAYWSWYRWQADRYRTPLSITFGEVATHNHFALDRGGKVFNRTAPVIKLPPEATEDDHLVLLAQLNSSTACFWLKQVCQNKGYGGARGHSGNMRLRYDSWAEFFQFGGTKLQYFPLAAAADPRLTTFAQRLDTLARYRQEDSVASLLAEHSARGSAAVTEALSDRRARDLARLQEMVGLQEELDWLCYRMYGVDPDAPANELRAPDEVPPLTPGERAFELALARADADRRAAVERGETPDEQPTAWFDRHGWDPVTRLDEVPEPWRAVTEARLARTASSRELGLLEQPTHKRRWYRPDYDKEEREAMALFLADRVEAVAQLETTPFTGRSIAAALQDDPAVEAVATLYAGKRFDLDRLVAQILDDESVPSLKTHVFKPKGLVKRAAWERTWEVQHAEDAWDAQKKAHEDAVAAGANPHDAPPLPAAPRPEPDVPSKYASGDFLRPTYWRHRGKLDVPKERFIAYTEAPAVLTDDGASPLYGWAGWDHAERANALLALDERAEEAGVPLEDRYALLWGIQFLLPYVRWGDADAQSLERELVAVLRHLLGDQGVTEELLATWTKTHAPPKRRSPKKKRAARAKK